MSKQLSASMQLAKDLKEHGTSEAMKEWALEYFSEVWEQIETDIDFSKYEPTDVSNSLHIVQYTYEIDGEKYHLSYPINSEKDTEPIIEKIKKDE